MVTSTEDTISLDFATLDTYFLVIINTMNAFVKCFDSHMYLYTVYIFLDVILLYFHVCFASLRDILARKSKYVNLSGNTFSSSNSSLKHALAHSE